MEHRTPSFLNLYMEGGDEKMKVKLLKKRKTNRKLVGWSSKITLPNGRVIYAKDYNIKAFPIFN
jgi:hypothetical protein